MCAHMQGRAPRSTVSVLVRLNARSNVRSNVSIECSIKCSVEQSHASSMERDTAVCIDMCIDIHMDMYADVCSVQHRRAMCTVGTVPLRQQLQTGCVCRQAHRHLYWHKCRHAHKHVEMCMLECCSDNDGEQVMCVDMSMDMCTDMCVDMWTCV